MKKRMLIHARQPEQKMVALIEGKSLVNFDIDSFAQTQTVANIYQGVIQTIAPSLDAVFVSYGPERHGFLPFKEIAPEYYQGQYDPLSSEKPNIRELLKEGQEILVQVTKEERGNKGAALTTYISLAGCYLVLMPNNPRAGGISRQIDSQDRQTLKEMIEALDVPESMGLIVRTAGVHRSLEELQWDLAVLRNLWDAILEARHLRKGAMLIHQESDIISRVSRDYLRPDVQEIWIDEPTVHQQMLDLIKMIRPDYVTRLKLYSEKQPLFAHFGVDRQIDSAFKREISLENGGSIVIDSTEALVAIDINSARATEGGDIEETALQTNLAAAKEIARQLRLRDIGGLIVVDFIDMDQSRHQRQVEQCLADAIQADRARVQMGKISRFGLLEMSRQRLRPSLDDWRQSSCPRCKGQGKILNIPALALEVIHDLHLQAVKEHTARLFVQVPSDLATYLFNEKRSQIQDIETAYQVHVVLIPNPNLQTPNYHVKRLRKQDQSDSTPSHAIELEKGLSEAPMLAPSKPRPEPAIQRITAAAPTPASSTSGLAKFLRGVVSMFALTPKKESTPTEPRRPARGHGRKRSRPEQGTSAGNKPQGAQGSTSAKRAQQPQTRPEKATSQEELAPKATPVDSSAVETTPNSSPNRRRRRPRKPRAELENSVQERNDLIQEIKAPVDAQQHEAPAAPVHSNNDAEKEMVFVIEEAVTEKVTKPQTGARHRQRQRAAQPAPDTQGQETADSVKAPVSDDVPEQQSSAATREEPSESTTDERPPQRRRRRRSRRRPPQGAAQEQNADTSTSSPTPQGEETAE